MLHPSLPPLRTAWPASDEPPAPRIGSPIDTIRHLKAAAAPVVHRRRKKQLPIGSPKWWARLSEKTAAAAAEREAQAQEEEERRRAEKEATEDGRNMLALWWLRVSPMLSIRHSLYRNAYSPRRETPSLHRFQNRFSTMVASRCCLSDGIGRSLKNCYSILFRCKGNVRNLGQALLEFELTDRKPLPCQQFDHFCAKSCRTPFQMQIITQ